MPQFFSNLFSIRPLAGRALAFAKDLKHPAYDCFYLALAEAEGAAFITNDKRLLNAVKGTKFAKHVVALEKWTPPKSRR